MIRFSGPVLVCGLASTGMGVMLLAVAGGIDGLVWLAAAVLVLGLVLLGMWVREKRRPPPPPDTPESVAASVPGIWYPFALLGILAAQAVWFVIWSKR
ncbi:hypothetical protein [Urbifossiella limnaea]|uniref:Uncharacterized protein n=1 Tax=Urbifossiella limnaea TaxID=2528023 RepID=A0A517XYH4_9BACT|nr:hypothetical protein [Urbifossiella limnaea]QDU22564.1 hypothetical protein ETAA1_45470 [Urbifossiella limnaea]